MRRLLILVLALTAACGGTALEDTETTSGSVDAETTTTAGPGATTTTRPADDPTTSEAPDTTGAEGESPTSDLPLAPDFTLELGTGGEYTLSSAGNPVYLVFWAEW